MAPMAPADPAVAPLDPMRPPTADLPKRTLETLAAPEITRDFRGDFRGDFPGDIMIFMGDLDDLIFSWISVWFFDRFFFGGGL